MFRPVEVPLWLLILILLLAGASLASHFLFPSVRWFFRRRAEAALARLNARLDRKIDLFKLARRSDMVSRLAYDAKVVEAAMAHAAQAGIPGSVALQEARRYAREIVPGFSATVYFGFGTRAAKWLSRILFTVRVGQVSESLGQIDPKAAVVFVMNHRSNIDYVLVTWLVADRSAVSYAVGEWARVWPLSSLIRSMGAYFIRRSSRNTLYRRVLARYVQMATEAGTTQAIFPEGGLSLDGRVGAAKLGLLSYIVEGWTPAERDVVFVPVGLGYDRVLEDRVLVEAAQSGTRSFRNRPFWVAGHGLRYLWLRMRGKTKGFGTAAASFGAPISLRAHLGAGGTVTTLGERLMAAIGAVVPVLPVPLVAAAIGQGVASRQELAARVEGLIGQLRAGRAVLQLPETVEAVLEAGLPPLVKRGLVSADLQPFAAEAELLAFYAAPVQQILA